MSRNQSATIMAMSTEALGYETKMKTLPLKSKPPKCLLRAPYRYGVNRIVWVRLNIIMNLLIKTTYGYTYNKCVNITQNIL